MSLENKNHLLMEEKTYDLKITADKNDVKCLFDRIDEPNWIKEEDWKSFANNGLQEARLWSTFPKIQKYTPNLRKIVPTIIYDSFEPKFISGEIENDPMAPILVECQRVLLPYASFAPTTEELRKNPSVIALQEAVKNGAELEIRLKRPTHIIALPKL